MLPVSGAGVSNAPKVILSLGDAPGRTRFQDRDPQRWKHSSDEAAKRPDGFEAWRSGLRGVLADLIISPSRTDRMML